MPEGSGQDRRDALAVRSVDLLRALTRTLEILGSGGDETAALTESFDGAARAFGAEKALLLGVKTPEPLELLSIRAVGLTPDEIEACLRGESIEGVSASRIRQAIESGPHRLLNIPGRWRFGGRGKERQLSRIPTQFDNPVLEGDSCHNLYPLRLSFAWSCCDQENGTRTSCRLHLFHV